MKKLITFLAAALLVVATAEARSSVNKSIKVADGETITQELSSVNGSITVGERAVLEDEAQTVNGSLTIGDDARTRDLSSVNGTIRLGDRVTVDGDVTTVNGTLRAGASTVQGNVETVNGTVDLEGTTVNQDLRTINGKVTLDKGTRVLGNLIVPEPGGSRGSNSWRGVLEIRLRGGSIVEGDLRIEEEGRKVRVILSEGAAVHGEIIGAEVVRD